MNDTQEQVSIEQAAAMLCAARHVIALTGAGISTPSGIPDFRTPGKGLWETADPFAIASIYAFRHDPVAFYRWVAPIVDTIRHASPNPAHVALARLEAAGVLKAIITQNIDGLHQQAGSSRVLELHGHLRSSTCLSCFRNWPADKLMDEVAAGQVPRCPACGGILKPDVILFGEQLPASVLGIAMEQVRQADLIMVIGSSLRVTPAADMPALVNSNGGRVIIFNQQPTHAATFARAVFRDDVAQVLPQVTRACVEESSS